MEADRERFVELFCDEAFMVFSGGTLTEDEAVARFDRMRENCERLDFAKQPVVERRSGVVVGYTGVDWFDFRGEQRLEFGYRLVPEARGQGYATEASAALLARAGETFTGEVLAIIAPTNRPSQRVIHKLGFTFSGEAVVDGWRSRMYRRPIPLPPSVPHRAGTPGTTR